MDYVFANSAAQEYTAPTISANLFAVPNATRIVVQYAYLPHVLSWPTVQSIALPMAADIGTGASSLPVDIKIGTVYYRLLYLDINSRVLATSDIQTI